MPAGTAGDRRTGHERAGTAHADGASRTRATAGIGELVKDLAGQTSTLVRQEIELAQAEVTEKGKVAGKGAGHARRRGRRPACSRSAP